MPALPKIFGNLKMESSEPKSSFLEVNGVQLHVLDWGGDGAPIVILHATGFLGRIYRPIAERLGAIGHVYSFDQRGHGDSSLSPDGEYNWQRTMDDLAGFIIKMGFDSVRAFGHSAGATAIGSLASERPDLISRAVLVEPVLFETPESPELEWRNPFYERTLKRKRIFDSVDAMFANFDHKPPYDTWRKDMLRDFCEFGTRVTADGKRELKCSPENEAKLYATSQEFDGLQRILRCEQPLLIMFGTRSDSLAASLSGKIANELKRGRVIDVPETGHFMPMEAPDYVADEAIKFLSSTSG
jgi:pimeloyl-ACP methyl ester carboxylesterase